MRSDNRQKRRGTALIYVVVSAVAMTALLTLAVDLAHARVVKSQLQAAADAAARYAVTGLWTGQATGNATAAAAAQYADGSPVAVLPADVVTGTSANGVYTPGGANPDSVQATLARTAARGTPVPHWWGRLMGKNQSHLTPSA